LIFGVSDSLPVFVLSHVPVTVSSLSIYDPSVCPSLLYCVQRRGPTRQEQRDASDRQLQPTIFSDRLLLSSHFLRLSSHAVSWAIHLATSLHLITSRSPPRTHHVTNCRRRHRQLVCSVLRIVAVEGIRQGCRIPDGHYDRRVGKCQIQACTSIGSPCSPAPAGDSLCILILPPERKKSESVFIATAG
jgi:hypothetical protein